MNKVKNLLLSAFASFLFLAPLSAAAQSVELTAHIGGQINGGVDLSTTRFRRIEVQNGLNYGATLGYLLGEHYGVEFGWSQNKSGTNAQPILSGPSTKVFSLSQNQYLGNFLFHFTNREAHLRPFGFFGLGATALSTDRAGVAGSTRFTFALGAGAKYNVSKHFGLRAQMKYAPTYLTTTNNGGYWCDPYWGGCWVVGKSHYLNAIDFTGGVTLRF